METNMSNKPTHRVFQVIETGKDKKFWNRIGGAWEHEDGNGFNLSLNSIPLDGRMVIRRIEKDDEE
jgi:hypothetical protein